MNHRMYVEKYLKKVQEEVSEPNRTLILDFVGQERAEKRSEARILEYLRTIVEIEKILGKPFREAEKRDIVRVVNAFREQKTKKESLLYRGRQKAQRGEQHY